MTDTRRKDLNWDVTNDKGTVTSWEAVAVAVLMDIRDEMKRLNSLLHCGNFIAIPQILRRVSLNTAKPKKKKKKKAVQPAVQEQGAP